MDKLNASQILNFATLLIGLGIQAIEQRAKNEGKTVDEILTDANDEWNQAQEQAEDLLKEGHEDE